MPGLITHTVAGLSLSIVGLFYFKEFFNNSYKKPILLVATCLSFSIIPDTFLGLYYTIHLLPFQELAQLHTLTHIMFVPIAFICLLLMRIDAKRKPYWAIALFAIILHLSMDLIIQETGPMF